MDVTRTEVASVLTRTGGYLATVSSHSLQPYAGCSYGSSLCGVGCYVRHNPWILRGRKWGSFLEVRENAAEAYLAAYERERRWARRRLGEMSVFLSSSTEPFPPQEKRHRVTRRVLEAMVERPPDALILQTHSPLVADELPLLLDLKERCRLRVHVSVETDRERLPGLPRHGSPPAKRLAAARKLHSAGVETVITVSPLLPVAEPERFFAEISESAGAVVLDHFIGGDGTADGRRTRRTPLPAAMEAVEPGSASLAYRDNLAAVARRHLAKVGVGPEGFAGRYLP